MNAPSRRYLSVWLKRLPTDRIARRSSAPDDAPLVVVAPVKSALRITAMNEAAARLGLIPGMALADARAMYPALSAADADPEADASCSKLSPTGATAIPRWPDSMRRTASCSTSPAARICSAARRRSAAIWSTAGVAGLAGLRGGGRYGRLRLGGRALRPRAGSSPKAARATFSRRCRSRRLRIDTDTVAALAQAGLKRIADVLDRPRAPLAARYGAGFRPPHRPGARPRG